MIKAVISVIVGISAGLLPAKAIAAERVAFDLFPFGQFYIQVYDLKVFVETGKVSDELAYYLNRIPPKQVARLPQLLSTPLEFNPLTIAKFSNSTIGATVIKNFGKGIRTKTNRNGFFALRSAIIAAAFDPEGLTIINLLERFPLSTIYIDLKVLDRYIDRGEKLFQNQETINELFFTDTVDRQLDLSTANSTKAGKYTWRKQTLTYQNPRRLNSGFFDLYLPAKKQATLIVISHGVASSRQTFSYLGEHLASHGFAVAIVEHNDISLNKFDAFLSGSERFPEPNNLIEQPQDIFFVLNKLEREIKINSLLKNKINLDRVGVIGHSFGGYTSLALAGGKLIPDAQAAKCQTDNYRDVLLDLSSLAQCTFDRLPKTDYQLKDPRIKATIAVNPMANIFEHSGMATVDIPTMLISGTNDLMMPPVAEQIQPFSWLNADIDKYLVLVKPGTHFSFLREGLGILPVPDRVVGISPTFAHPIIKSLSTSFFKVHLEEQWEYQKYLQSQNYRLTPNNPLELSIIRSISDIQLQKLIGR